MRFVNVTMKFGSMRKDQEWTVYPPKDDGIIKIQSRKRMAYICLHNGKGVMSSDPYFLKGKVGIQATASQLEELRLAYAKMMGRLNADGTFTIIG